AFAALSPGWLGRVARSAADRQALPASALGGGGGADRGVAAPDRVGAAQPLGGAGVSQVPRCGVDPGSSVRSWSVSSFRADAGQRSFGELAGRRRRARSARWCRGRRETLG